MNIFHYFMPILLSLNNHLRVVAVDPWNFTVLADWHGAESFTMNAEHKDDKNEKFVTQRGIFTSINTRHTPELIILPGDTNGGRWYKEEFRKKFMNNLDLEDMSPNEIIYQAGKNCYEAIQRLLKQAGFDKVLTTVGDHEYGKYIISVCFNNILLHKRLLICHFVV